MGGCGLFEHEPFRLNLSLVGHGPDATNELTRDSHNALVGVVTSGDALSVALTQALLGLPTDVWEPRGWLLPSALQMATHCGRGALGPGAFDHDPTRVGVACRGERAWATAFTPCRRCGGEAQ